MRKNNSNQIHLLALAFQALEGSCLGEAAQEKIAKQIIALVDEDAPVQVTGDVNGEDKGEPRQASETPLPEACGCGSKACEVLDILIGSASGDLSELAEQVMAELGLKEAPKFLDHVLGELTERLETGLVQDNDDIRSRVISFTASMMVAALKNAKATRVKPDDVSVTVREFSSPDELFAFLDSMGKD